MRDVSGGLSPELYRTYARLLDCNELCEQFVTTETPTTSAGDGRERRGGAAVLATELESFSLESSVLLSLQSSESPLNFDPISKKRWLEMRHLLDDEFLRGAPEDVRGALQLRRDRDYDYLKPLTRLRNQVYVT